MKNLFLSITTLLAVLLMMSCNQSKYKYETVPNDPLKVRMYTLDNGLKVYLSVNKDKPRVQTYIAVRVGAKNDPAETTGLAHYFEHLMFKGTQKFGTSDYEAEKPLLDEVEALFEKYRKTTDEAERKAIYAQIDSVSQEASKIAIPNEYDKLMSAIGSQGTNAYTSYDVTAYIENIPKNEIENWAMLQSDRFQNPVLRLFHTELETVYEEYNMSLTSDGRKIMEAMLQNLYPHHPYGTQTVLGTQDHLKNPSITNIKNYFDTYYVPNNMAIVMAGDFDPDEAIATIDKYFGSLQPKEIPSLQIGEEPEINAPIVKDVVGLEAENVTVAFRTPAANDKDMAVLELVDYLLTNGKAGLIDLNLVQAQKTLSAGSYIMSLADHGNFVLYGTPKQGQTLEEVKDLLLGQIELLKKGDFDESLMGAVINNFRLNTYYQQQEAGYAASLLVNAFTNGTEWKDMVDKVDRQSKVTKQDIVDICNKYFKDNYVVINKKQGKPDENKIDKPQITPISTNRDNESAFLAEIKSREITPIEPVFLDYSKDLDILKAKQNIEILYKQNTTNPLFSMNYVFEMGNNNDKALGTAFSYLNYLGTSKRTAEEIKTELYNLACSFGVYSTSERVYVSISGLSDNFEKAMELLEERLTEAVVDMDAYNNLTVDILKGRDDAKHNQSRNFNQLVQYALWGPKSASTNILSAEELKAMNPQELVDRIKNLKNYEHTILYYGPLSATEITDVINKKHITAEQLQPVPEPVRFVEQETTENKVLLANYDAKQIYLSMVNKGGKFDKSIESKRSLYNNYFGGGMNSIVFQEMREARGLAYSAYAGYSRPNSLEYSYYFNAFIATQGDKMKDAISAFNEIINDMPQSEKAFNIAKESQITNIRTGRILRDNILWNYMDAKKMGYDTDSRKDLYEALQTMTLDDVTKFQQEYIKNKPFVYCVLGDIKSLDLNVLKAIGPITTLSQEQIFGY